MYDAADAFTQVTLGNSEDEDDTISNESYETDFSIESMPSLEPREEEDEDDESENKSSSQDEVIPPYLPEHDDDDPDVPIPIVDEGNDEEEVIADAGNIGKYHEAPPSSVNMVENDTVSILNNDEEPTPTQ